MSLKDHSRYFVFTGGPGFGKSAVLDALNSRGYTCIPEAPRLLIEEQRSLQSGILPQTDFVGFADLVVNLMVRQYHETPSDTVLFDRGIPDIIAYLENAGMSVSPKIHRAVEEHPYAATVFRFPAWQDIYELDGIRYESFEEAREIGVRIKQAYSSLGYRVVDVPLGPPGERVEFVLDYFPPS